ncbi:VOC family protein [Ferruginibacter sp.]
MNTKLLGIIPVLPSADIARDTKWYSEKTGFETRFADNMYAVLLRGDLCIHLQWHADTPGDPLLGGSVIRIYVKEIKDLFEEMVQRGTVTQKDLRMNTPWGTNEFGFFDLNRNAIFIMEEAE